MKLQKSTKVLQALRVLQQHIGVDEEAEEPTITAAEVWRLYWEDEGHRMRTAGNAAIAAKCILRDLGSLPAMALTQKRVKTWRDGKLESGMSPNTINRVVAVFKRSYAWALEQDEPPIPYNPLAGLKQLQRTKRKGKIWKDSDLEAICQHLPAWATAVVLVAAWTGARIMAVMTMKWRDVDWETGEWTVSLPECRNKLRGHPWIPKKVRDFIRSELPDDSEWVFRSQDRRRFGDKPPHHYGYQYMNKLWRRACDRAGISTADGRALIHHLRHGFSFRATEVLKKSLRWTMFRGGWATAEQALAYGAIADGDDAAVRDEIEAMVTIPSYLDDDDTP